MTFWPSKRVVVGIGGGIAAYKTVDLIRRLREQGAQVTVVVTAAALQFITRMTLQAISGAKVWDDLFALDQEQEMGHIRLARAADLVIVAPATADLLARLACGQADDLLTTLLLARAGQPVLLAPAMNPAMWHHPATQRNVARLQADGLLLVGPESGAMACGEEGMGRLATTEAILEAGRRAMTPARWQGRRLLVTAGPTCEALDPVRYLGNRSSGKMGWAVALAAARLGAEVQLVHGPIALPPPDGVRTVAVTSAAEMYQAAMARWPDCHAAILTAAVADFRPQFCQTDKIKKPAQGAEQQPMTLVLQQTEDILAAVVAQRRPGQVVVGFAAETTDVEQQGWDKLRRKGCDLLAVNDVTAAGCGFEVDTNQILLLGQQGQRQSWPMLTKEETAERLLGAVEELWPDY
ncbi:MAG: bifunctional phosphopantothenoylcysteine decarboxylase/phosphopantothenate--cysteine ligase CoaBC [Magnetococcales bacterium]|nr:bifunctional phosphopantothenoylcysteine decarboxylase/phosphopantothenate--cysteine ligase CoaBC [Magnetococcales bacterium]